uniref:C2H2-type domain-containing protein n=1 Tax=Capitella teleta TaxID=283909 RepID=X2AYG3_CAPTE
MTNRPCSLQYVEAFYAEDISGIVRVSYDYPQYISNEDARRFVRCLPDGKAQCTLCGLSYAVQRSCTRHIRYVHLNSKKLECPNWALHVKVMPDGTTTCVTCGKCYRTENSCKTHVTAIHLRPFRFRCPFCPAQFSYKHRLKSHMQLHLQTARSPSSFFCFTDRPMGQAQNHKTQSSTSGSLAISKLKVSSIEPMRINVVRAFELGYRRGIDFRKNAVNSYQCLRCGMHFTRRDNCRRHMLKKHARRPFPDHPIIPHSTIHHPLPLHNMTSSDILKKCLMGMTDSGLFKCFICSKEFTAKVNCKRHVLSVHLNRQRFACPVCGKRVLGAPGVRMLTPSKFQCVHCGTQFNHKVTARRHVKNFHEPKQSHRCPYCQRNYSRLDYLKVHVKKHIQEMRQTAPSTPQLNYNS